MPQWIQKNPKTGKFQVNIPKNEPVKTEVPYKNRGGSRRSSNNNASNNPINTNTIPIQPKKTVMLPPGMSEQQYYGVNTSLVKNTGVVSNTGAISFPRSNTIDALAGSNINDPSNQNIIDKNVAKNRTPFYSLFQSETTVAPNIVDPTNPDKIITPGTVETAGRHADKTTGFVTKVAATGMVVGTAGAAAMPIIGAGSAAVGLGSTGTAALQVGGLLGFSQVAAPLSRGIHKQSTFLTNKADYDLMNDPHWNDAIAYGKWMNQQKADSNKDVAGKVFGTIGSWIPGVKQIMSSGGIKENVTDFYLSKGYSKSDAKRFGELAFESTYAEGVGDVAGSISLETSSEILGHHLSKYFFTKFSGKATRRVTKTAVASLVPAGFMEGAGEYTKERIMEGQDIKLWETHNIAGVPLPGGIIGSGLFGSAFATGMGTTIARKSITNPVRSKQLLTVARIIDPYEYPGDVLGGAIIKGKFGRKNPSLRIITPEAIPNSAINLSKDATGMFSTKPSASTSITNYFSTSNSLSMSNVPSSNDSIIAIVNPSNVPSNVPDLFPSPPNNPTPNIVPLTDPSNVITPSNVPSEVPTEVPIPLPTNISFTTQAPSSVPTNVPMPSPLLRVPIMPLHGGGGRGSKGMGGFGLGKGYSFKEFKIPTLDKILGKASGKGTGFKSPSLKSILGDIKI